VKPGIDGIYLGDGSICGDCNNNGIPDETDIEMGTSQDCNTNSIPDECDTFGCCGPTVGQCGNTLIDICMTIGGNWLGDDCLQCPRQSVGIIVEPGGQVFIHNIGPPVDCDLGAPSPGGGCVPGQFIDPWKTEPGGCQQFGVPDSPAIPAGFFETGSDPFTGTVCLEGVPLGPTPFGDFGEADTLILRTQDPFDRCDLPDPNPVVVPIEIVALSLESVSPITVTFNGGQDPENWDVVVDLSAFPAPLGQLSATKSHCNGGTYTSVLNVQPRFTFTKVGDPGEVRVLDTGVPALGISPTTFDASAMSSPWVHDVDPPYDTTLDPCTAFHGGLDEMNPTTLCDCNNNGTRDRCDLEDCPGGNVDCQDCNDNGVPDSCDIGSGSSTDNDTNGVPDECVPVGCAVTANCADTDANGTRDDNCVWWECAAGSCLDTTLTQFADMGGAYGVCPPDTFANVHDKNHALSCFSGTNTCDAINIDAGGEFGQCPPDGFCNIHDVNHALSAFAGTTTCSCPSGPAPAFDPAVVGEAVLTLVPRTRTVQPGGTIAVDVFIDGRFDALRSYQLDVRVTGGKGGALKLVDMRIDDRKDAIFGGRADAFDAFNVNTSQMLSGLNGGNGVSIKGPAYLATFTYEASQDVSGQFVVDINGGENGQTYLIAPGDGEVTIGAPKPAVVGVSKRR
jgi:hypothetical protein